MEEVSDNSAAVIGQEVRFFSPRHDDEQEAWATWTRVLTWEVKDADLLLYHRIAHSSRRVDTLAEAVDLIDAAGQWDKVGGKWTGEMDRLRPGQLWTPRRGEFKDGVMSGQVTGHVVTVKRNEKERVGTRVLEYAPQVVPYITVLQNEVFGEVRQAYHVRVAVPGTCLVPEAGINLSDVASKLYWELRAAYPFGALVAWKQSSWDWTFHDIAGKPGKTEGMAALLREKRAAEAATTG